MHLKHITRRLAILLLSLACVLSLSAYQAGGSSEPQDIELKNAHLSLRFDKSDGRILALVDLRTKASFVDPSTSDTALWTIDFLPGTTPASLASSSAKSFRWERPGPDNSGLRMVWERFNLPSARGLRVEATVELEAMSPLSRWSIAIANLGPLLMEKVRFPRVVSIHQQPEERLAVPQWMGELTKNPRGVICDRQGQPHRLEWPYPGALSLQCLALYRENGPGLYFSSDDTAAFRKAFAFWGETDRRIGYEVIHHPENLHTPRASYNPSYHTLIGTFTGDWITAAERYRQWGTKQEWARNSRLNRGLVPDWLLKTGFWVWNRGRSDQVLKPAQALHRQLGLPVSVFWHWWHGCAYDAGFPEYLPPREGADSFKQALREAHRGGLHAIVYMNQRLWGMTTESWKDKGAERFAVKTIDGSVRPEIYNTYTRQPCASMCMATSFWRDTYAGIAEQAVRDLGVDGIYMDQACSSLLCYDPSHGHPLGGGTFWMNGFRMLSSDIRTRIAPNKSVLLAGEGSGEAWLPYLDLMLTLQVSRERYARPGDGWEVIPFFQAVYHNCGVTYGNYSSLTIPPYDELWPAEFAPKEPLKLLDTKYATQFYLEQARTFAWGSQPTLANFMPSQLQERRDELHYLMKLARIRYKGLKYLLYGTFLRPPQVNAPAVSVDICRLSVYAGRRARIEKTPQKLTPDDGPADSTGGNEITHTSILSPGVIVGAWQAKDGDIGIALASILDKPVSFEIDLKPYGAGGRDHIYFIDEGGRKELHRAASSASVKIDLRPRGACIVELTKPQ